MQENIITPDDVAMCHLLTEIVKLFVEDTKAVTAELSDGQESKIIPLVVAPTDLGTIFGKRGQTMHSLRTIMGAASMKLYTRYALDVQNV